MINIKIFHDNIDFLGGGERLILNLARNLSADIYCYNLNPELEKYIKKYNLKINAKKKLKKNNFLLKVYSFFYFLFLPLRYSSSKTIEIYSGNFSFLSSFFSKGKKIFYCHCPPKFIIYYPQIKKDYNLLSKLLIFIFKSIYIKSYKLFLKKSDFIIANSKFTKNRLKKFTSKNIKIINPPNTFNVNFDNSKIKYSNFFLSNARLDNAKNVFELVYAFEKIKEKKLVICNDGELKDDIKKYIYDKKIKNIFYINYLDDLQYVSLLKDCLAVIYIPSNEDYGMTVKEAFYFGKSVIVYNSGYLPELVMNKKNGLILDRLRVIDFKKAIVNNSINDFKKMGNYAKKTYYNLEKNNDFYKLINEIIHSIKF